MLTTCATGMLCAAIMTDHWEEVTWDRLTLDHVANNSVRLRWLLDGMVARISTNDEKDKIIAFLVPMHGGIWTLCLTLTGKIKQKYIEKTCIFLIAEEEIALLSRVGFPSVQPCVNYLSDRLDGIRGYEPRGDWQHRKCR